MQFSKIFRKMLFCARFSFSCHRHLCSRPNKGALPAVFDPKFSRGGWNEFWDSISEKQNQNDSRVFSMCLPPPNVTGKLHLGHAFTVAIEDTVVRWNRMNGKKVVWIPGFDHAGIATQVQVEKHIHHKYGLSRKDMTRGDFVTHCQQWKDDRISDIRKQLETMGASLDWNHCYYTMDSSFQAAVSYAFCRLYDSGLIYRSNRLVNWCPSLQSAISDQEVEIIQIPEPTEMTFGKNKDVAVGYMYSVKYPVENSDTDFVTIATTRPETILADVAIAVHPDDTRYSTLIGRNVTNPVTGELIPVICDQSVSRELGTGALKVTPCHDFTDWEIGERNSLQMDRSCLDANACITHDFPSYEGLDRFEARDKILTHLYSSNLFSHRIPHPTSLPVCSRSGDLIEPMSTEQWFMDCRRICDHIGTRLQNGDFNIKPQFLEAEMKHWLKQSGDWCLSRQIAWGHRIPAYRYGNSWSVAESDSEALTYFQSIFPNEKLEISDLHRDSDVLDTWFSSSLVPLFVSGWPKEGWEKSNIFPLNLMETGHDILGFWVVRMMLMTLLLTEKLPFQNIFLHGLLRDGQGRKMSKSLGNVIDPMDVIQGKSLLDLERQLRDATGISEDEKDTAVSNLRKELPKGLAECGVDALRLALLRHDASTLNVNVDVNQFTDSRNFCNKIWNAFKLCQMLWEKVEPTHKLDNLNFNPEDRWILSRISNLVDNFNCCMEKVELHTIAIQLYQFMWHEFCDVYLERLKPALYSDNRAAILVKSSVCSFVLDIFLRSLAPIMPYISEELYGRLPNMEISKTQSVHTSSFPKDLPYSDSVLDQQMRTVLGVRNAIRSARKEFGIGNKTQLNVSLSCPESTSEAVNLFQNAIQTLVNVKLQHSSNVDSWLPVFVSEDTQLYIQLTNIDKQSVISRLEREMEKRKKRVQQLESKEAKWRKTYGGKERRKEKLESYITNSRRSVANLESEIERLESILNSIK